VLPAQKLPAATICGSGWIARSRSGTDFGSGLRDWWFSRTIGGALSKSHSVRARRRPFSLQTYSRQRGPTGLCRLDQPAPLLQVHYRAFDAAMGCSAPAPRFGTLALAVGAACGLSLHVVGVTKHRFSRSIRKPGRASRRAMPADLRGALGERFLRAGTTGSGQAATALADFLRGVEMLAASEALRIGSALVSKPERCWR